MSENIAPILFIFGFGYTVSALSRQLMEKGYQIVATSRSHSRRKEMKRLGIRAYDFADREGVRKELRQATHLLCSIAPIKLGDTVLHHFEEDIKQNDGWQWIGYLSSTGVYGNHDGGWVDEETPVKGNSERTKARVVAERKWLRLRAEPHSLPVQLFRLAGIYGAGRGVVSRLRKGMEQRIYKEDQIFSRIHVEDIARALIASMNQPQSGDIYNVCDDVPEASHIVAEYAATQMGVEVPPLVDWSKAELSEMAREFYNNNRRVRNQRIKQLLPDGEWLYPSYQQGIVADIKALSLKEAVND